MPAPHPVRPWHLDQPPGNPYFDFTDLCNTERVLVVLASGQACVWYRLTLASKDGDWIIREAPEVMDAVRARLAQWGARYRLGAPLDCRWLAAGWSSHFEAVGEGGVRLRFDFVSRPPRLTSERLEALWRGVDGGQPAVVGRNDLIVLKQTMRLKDYPFIGSLALQLDAIEDQVRWTLDAEHFLSLLEVHPEIADRLHDLRPALAAEPREVEAIAEAMDREVRRSRRLDEQRMAAYASALQPWAGRFREGGFTDQPLELAHSRMCLEAEGCLPLQPPAVSLP